MTNDKRVEEIRERLASGGRNYDWRDDLTFLLSELDRAKKVVEAAREVGRK